MEILAVTRVATEAAETVAGIRVIHLFVLRKTFFRFF
jgi:hypothetical protein